MHEIARKQAHMLELDVQEVDTLDAPGWVEWVVGIGVGIALGAGAVAIT